MIEERNSFLKNKAKSWREIFEPEFIFNETQSVGWLESFNIVIKSFFDKEPSQANSKK